MEIAQCACLLLLDFPRRFLPRCKTRTRESERERAAHTHAHTKRERETREESRLAGFVRTSRFERTNKRTNVRSNVPTFVPSFQRSLVVCMGCKAIEQTMTTTIQYPYKRFLRPPSGNLSLYRFRTHNSLLPLSGD